MTADPPFESEALPEFTPDDRLRAVAAIFAAGIARLHARASCAAETTSDEPAVVIEKPLEDRR